MTELEALKQVHDALAAIEDQDARYRILRWANDRFGAELPGPGARSPASSPPHSDIQSSGTSTTSDGGPAQGSIGKRAMHWLSRMSLRPETLRSAFDDLGNGFEIVAAELPGTNSRERVRSAYLLLGVLELLRKDSTDFLDADAREICRHYRCFDPTNHTKAVRAIGTALVGDASTGFRLSPTGERQAAELIRMLAATDRGLSNT